MNLRKTTLEAVYERDIDLCLIEALYADSEFRTWLLSRCDLRMDTSEIIDILHSVSNESGETDIQIQITAEGEKIAVLLENKVNAGFQRNQLERYHLRGSQIKGLKTTESFSLHHVIISPM